MRTILQDIRFSLRSFRRAPAFALAATATLALGVGATTAIFTTLNAVLLKPLPYPNPDNLYSIRTTLTDGRVTTGLVAGSEIFRLNDPNLSIERAAAMQAFDLTLLHEDGTPQHIKMHAVTEGFFELFGLPMTRGGFTPDQFAPLAPPPQAAPDADDGPPPAPAIVISDRIWRTLYKSDDQAIGKSIRFAEITGIIAGVAPRGFDTPHGADFWTANRVPRDDLNHGNEGFMRIKRGADIERVKSEMATVIAGLGRDFPESARNRAYVTKPLVDSIVGDLGPILIIVMSATGVLLLLACVNVTNLLLARGAARAREMALRVSLGAGGTRIVSQLLTESLLLAAAGSILGVMVAYAGVRGLMALGASRLPRLDAVTFDGSVLLFALAALVVSGLLVGIVPALRLARTDVRTLLNESSRSTSSGRSTGRWLSVMTVAEIALAILLVAGAGWLVRGFAELRNTNLGFSTDKRVIFDVTFQPQRYPNPPAVHTARTNLLDAVRGLQGVSEVGAATAFPLRGTLEGSLILQFQGQAMDPARPMGSRQRIASPGFFGAMGTQNPARPRFRPRRRSRIDADRHRQPHLREPLPSGPGSDWGPVRRRLSTAEPGQPGDDRRRGRRHPPAVGRGRSRTRVLPVADTDTGEAHDDGRRDHARGSDAGDGHDSAGSAQGGSADRGRLRAGRRLRGLDHQPAAARDDIDDHLRRWLPSCSRRLGFTASSPTACHNDAMKWPRASRWARRPRVFSGS